MQFAYQPYKESKELADALIPLMNEHGLERMGAQRFLPNTAKIIQLWHLGIFHLILARDEKTQKLVGYQLWSVSDKIFESGKLAMMGPVFLTKENRGNLRVTKDFIAFGVSTMKFLGATDIRAECDADQPTEAMYRRSHKAEVVSSQVRFLV